MESPSAHNPAGSDEAFLLPPEAWVHVLSFVDAKTVVASVGLVSHAFHALSTEPQLWRRFLLRDFPPSPAGDSGTGGGEDESANLYEGEPDGWRKSFFARRHARTKRPRFCLLGHVDSGKSTLMGRMLLGLGQITSEEINRLDQAAMMIGKGSFKYAWCCDRTRAERERGITIDWKVKECTLASGREIEIVDVPGHPDFNKNAFIGASLGDVAMLVVAAGMGEFEAGVGDNRWSLGGTRQHMLLAKSLGMSKMIVVVNKMDDYSVRGATKSRFTEIKDEVLVLASRVGLNPDDLVVVPISAWSGENVVTPRSGLSWYEGPMLFEAMEQMATAITTASARAKVSRRPVFGPTRVSVLRRVSKHCISGTGEPKKVPTEEVVEALVQSGSVREGQVLEAVLAAPSAFGAGHSRRGHIMQKPTTTATFTVVSIQRLDKPRPRAAAGEYIGLRLRLENFSPDIASSQAAAKTIAPRHVSSSNAKRRVTPRLRRGAVLTAATEPGAAAGESALKGRVESFTVRLEHTQTYGLRCGFAPTFIIHSALLSCRVEKILNFWDKDGEEVKFDPSNSKTRIQVDKGMTTLVQVKPLIDVFVEPFASCAALGTVLVIRDRRLAAFGGIESVQRL